MNHEPKLAKNKSICDFKINNFDLIRLLTALQIVFIHCSENMKIDCKSPLTSIIYLFPGLPIFFFITGFLISKSYETNPVIKAYAKNRILRVYPGLIVCTILTIFSIYLTGYFKNTDITIPHAILWILGQLTFAQFYNPNFMHGFGLGNMNGPLWTIVIELQFYTLTPILYYMFGLAKNTKKKQNLTLTVLILFFMIVNILFFSLSGRYSHSLLIKIWRLSFLPWFYMFLLGVLLQKNFEIIHRFLRARFLLILPLYITCAYFAKKYLLWKTGNAVNPLLFILLVTLIFSAAYSFPRLSGYLLRRNDFSYGTYIYHVPIINLFIYYGYVSKFLFLPLVLTITLITACISWFLIERPSMRLKQNPLNPRFNEKPNC